MNGGFSEVSSEVWKCIILSVQVLISWITELIKVLYYKGTELVFKLRKAHAIRLGPTTRRTCPACTRPWELSLAFNTHASVRVCVHTHTCTRTITHTREKVTYIHQQKMNFTNSI